MPRPTNTTIRPILTLALVVLTLSVYWPVTENGFINFDDPIYVTDNARVQSGLSRDNIVWALTTTETGNWHPLTWLSHMADCHLFGMAPQGHHLTSLVLHGLNGALLFWVLVTMTGSTWASALVAAMFAFHPLHVEPVAWVAERKEILCAFFWLTTIGGYAYYVRTGMRAAYGLSFLCFLIGLTAKPMIVTLPFVLLLLDYWPLKRFQTVRTPIRQERQPGTATAFRQTTTGRIILEKIPFLVSGGAISLLTYYVQEAEGAVKALSVFPWVVRLSNALHAYGAYLAKGAWPQGLAVFYPHPGAEHAVWQTGAVGAVLAGLSLLALLYRRHLPYLFVGWFWYLGTLVPVIGFVQVGSHAMADRYTYVPLIGIFVAVAWGLRDACNRWPLIVRPVALCTVLAVLLYAVVTGRQTKHWKDSLTLFQHTVEVTRNNWLAHDNLGLAWAERGDLEKALIHHRESIRLNPLSPNAYNNLGIALADQGNTLDAVSYFEKALAIRPDFVDARYNLANALVKEQRMEAAVYHYRQALKRSPEDWQIHNNLGIALMKRGHIGEAVTHFRRALRIRPDDPNARNNLEVACSVWHCIP